MNPPSKDTFVQFLSLTIPAGTTKHLAITGSVFLCKEATAEFEMAFNEGQFFDFDAGLSFSMSPGDVFQRLAFKNDSGAAITVEFYAGNMLLQDNRLITPLTPTYTFLAKPPATRATASGVVALAASGTHSFSGTDTGDDRRQFVIANMDVAAVLYVQTSGSVVMGVVQPLTSWTIETDADLEVKNPGVGSVNYVVGQTWFA